MKKIIIIIISVLALVLIATGIFLSLNDDKNESHPSVDQEVLDEREKNDELDVATNELVFDNVDAAISYLTELYVGGSASIESNYEYYCIILVLTSDGGNITYRYYYDNYVLVQE